MLRIRAVQSLLVEEIAGIAGASREGADPGGGEDTATELAAADRAGERDVLRRAEKRALTLVVLCWVAIGVLFLTYQGPAPFLRFAGAETVFTLGILLVAVYSGFRLGQWEKYRAVSRLYEELAEREPREKGPQYPVSST